MKDVSAATIALLRTGRALIGDLYSITLLDGSVDYFSGLDVPVTWQGNVYKANSLRIEKLQYKVAVGFQVDEQEVTIIATPTDTLAGALFLENVGQGLLDGAYITRARGVWTPTTGIPAIDYQATPQDVIPLYTGRVSTLVSVGRTHAVIKVKSPLVLLDLEMPKNTYTPSCLWTLYDAGCTVARASFTQNYSVSGVSTFFIAASGVSPVVGADGNAYYAQGRLLFTSGALTNLQVTIKSNDSTGFSLVYPLTTLPAVGDFFAASAGCSKTADTCNLKFSNSNNFRGFPRVPPMNISV